MFTVYACELYIYICIIIIIIFFRRVLKLGLAWNFVTHVCPKFLFLQLVSVPSEL